MDNYYADILEAFDHDFDWVAEVVQDAILEDLEAELDFAA